MPTCGPSARWVTWDTWERHRAGEAMVKGNVWHTTIVHEPGEALFITPGAGTEHRPLG